MALSILPFSLLTLYGELLRGLKRIRDSTLVQGVSIPLLNLPLLAILGGTLGTPGAAIAYAVSCILTLMIGVLLWRRATPQLAGRDRVFNTRLLITTSLPLFGVALMNLVMGTTDTIFLGIWTDSTSVGVYNVCLRLAALNTYALAAVNTIIAPMFAAIYAQGDYLTLDHLARHSSMLIVLLALPLSALYILFPAPILGLFGSEFSMGASALAILTVGQFINVASGSVGYLLIMTGHEMLVRNNTAFSLALNIVLQILLIPKLGLLGAAISTATSLAVMNGIAVVLAYRKLSIVTLPFPRRLFQRREPF
jgi:O-antigen/teichoic acid export membrane protein